MKKTYESPAVTKVEFDASDRITASPCAVNGIQASTGCTNFDI